MFQSIFTYNIIPFWSFFSVNDFLKIVNSMNFHGLNNPIVFPSTSINFRASSSVLYKYSETATNYITFINK